MVSSLMNPQAVVYLAQHLVSLNLLARSKLLFIGLDYVSALSMLTSLQVESCKRECVWARVDQLTCLTSLKSFRQLDKGAMQGPAIKALATLPCLTHLKLSCLEQVQLQESQFTALQVLSAKRPRWDGPPIVKRPLMANMLCLLPAGLQREPSFGVLTVISIAERIITGRPWPLQAIPLLSTFKLKCCDFTSDDWLCQSLQNALQVKNLVLTDCDLLHPPNSVYNLIGLTHLDLGENLLEDLSTSLLRLTG